MFQSGIDVIKKSVNELIKRQKPPENVMIRYDHAAYLGCQYWSNGVPIQTISKAGLAMPVTGQILVSVKLLDLYNSLKVATGVEYQELRISKPEPVDSGAVRTDADDSIHAGSDQNA